MARSRTAQTARDMVLSMAVVVAAVAVVVLLLPRGAVEQPPVDVRSGAAAARAALGADVVVPRVPEGWTPTATSVEEVRGTATWVLSLLTPDGRSVQVLQAVDPPEGWVAEATERADGDRSLLARAPGGVVVAVRGRVPADVLAELGSALPGVEAVPAPRR